MGTPGSGGDRRCTACCPFIRIASISHRGLSAPCGASSLSVCAAVPLRLGGRHGGDDGTKCRDLPPRSDRPRVHNQLGVVARVRGRGAQFEGRATHAAGDGHANDRFEISHIPTVAVARDAPAEDAAVVVKVLDAPVARAAVVAVERVLRREWRGRGQRRREPMQRASGPLRGAELCEPCRLWRW